MLHSCKEFLFFSRPKGKLQQSFQKLGKMRGFAFLITNKSKQHIGGRTQAEVGSIGDYYNNVV